MPQGRYSDVVEKLKPGAVRPGEIVHVDGRVLGRHEGVIHYTVGQRRGLGIAAGEALFVVRLDAEKAQVVVGPRAALATRSIVLRDLNWLGDDRIAEEGVPVFARVRSTRPPAAAMLSVRDGRIVVELAADEIGVAPGRPASFTIPTGRRRASSGAGRSRRRAREHARAA